MRSNGNTDVELAEVIDEELARLPGALSLGPGSLLPGRNERRGSRPAVGTAGWNDLVSAFARRELFRGRLASRGVVVTGALLGTFLTQQVATASLPTALAGATLKGAALARGQSDRGGGASTFRRGAPMNGALPLDGDRPNQAVRWPS